MSAGVLPLGAEHLAAATALLTEAFAPDSGMRAICGGGGAAGYRRRLAAWFRATLRLQLATQQPAWVIVADDRPVGVALMTHPRARSAPQAWLGWLLAVGARCGWGAVWRTAQHDRQRGAQRPAQAHAVLEFIAVDEGHRGRGYAAALLETARQWSAARRLAGIWLETTRPPNLPFFARYGYQVTGRMPLGQGEALALFRAQD